MSTGYIKIRGAREHNLKNISVDIPKNQLVIITGVSGSGKSSLVLDTIYKEAYRRYIDALSVGKKWIIEQVERPDVDIIQGLPPAICIRQWESHRNPRSTVGTITEIYDYLRVLFSNIGKPYCPKCGKEIVFYSSHEMLSKILSLEKGKKVQLLAPVSGFSVSNKKLSSSTIIQDLRKNGFVRIRADGKIYMIDQDIDLKEIEKAKNIEAIVDRLVIKEGIRKRLLDSIELALSISDGILLVDIVGEKELLFVKRPICINCGFSMPDINAQMFSFNNPKGACELCGGLGSYKGNTCPQCNGTRLKFISRCIKVNGASITELSDMPLEELHDFFKNISLSKTDMVIADRIIKEIQKRLGFIINMGLGYLSLNRSVVTLSGGEEQRIRLAAQLSSELSGVLYIMDEPTMGLHPKEVEKLISSIKILKNKGNSLLIVEHDPELILSADHVIELGPGAGEKGGRIIFQGNPERLLNSDTPTGKALSKREETSAHRRKVTGEYILIKGAKEHNLKGIDVKIPLGVLTCITGVSGSGKSSLIRDVLYPAVLNRTSKPNLKEGDYDRIEGVEHIKKIVYIDQSPVGKTPRSNPATYTGVFSHIRRLFSMLPESRIRGYKASRFSLNVEGGRCEACKGEGIIRLEMEFLPDLYITCEQCEGKRFNQEVLEIRYKGMNIADVLDMTAEQSFAFFENIPSISSRLKTFLDVGLGYIKLGQPANMLSGGEAQRLKIIRELNKARKGKTLYLLDEPTIGLHLADIKRLIRILNRLVEEGNTVIIIEHNLDVIMACDYVIDLGPEGGERGGYVVATGTPEEISRVRNSYTGMFIKKWGHCFKNNVPIAISS